MEEKNTARGALFALLVWASAAWAQAEPLPAPTPAHVPAVAEPAAKALTVRRRDFRSRRAQPLDEAAEHAAAVLPYAALAHEVYCNDLYERLQPEQVVRGNASCRLENVEMAQGWQHLLSYSGETLQLPGSGSGLRLAVYFNDRGPHEPVSLGVAFRGTDMSSWDDWHSNLRWFLPGVDQYDAVAALAEQVIDESQKAVRARLGRAVERWHIVTTGHSLGGGLAQLFAYKSKQVNGAVVFDPSPVTGYHSCLSREETNCNVPIWRVYERGEVLSYARALTRMFYSLSENITELEFDLLGGDALNNHGMSPFFLQLRAAAQTLRVEPSRHARLFEPRVDCTCVRERKLRAEYDTVRAACEALALQRDGAPPPVYSAELMALQEP